METGNQIIEQQNIHVKDDHKLPKRISLDMEKQTTEISFNFCDVTNSVTTKSVV